MYKKLHKEETRPHREPQCHGGSFFSCVPERGIMLTKNVWSIHSETIPFSNNSLTESVTFSLPLLKISSGRSPESW